MILVIGPSFADTYQYVTTQGRDQAYPALKVESEPVRLFLPGGAAYVARCVHALGRRVVLATGSMRPHMYAFAQNLTGIEQITTDRSQVQLKQRIVDRTTNAVLLRMDQPLTQIGNPWLDRSWTMAVHAALDEHELQVVVISDYGRGFFDEMPRIIFKKLVKMKTEGHHQIIVDPYTSTEDSLDRYRFATHITPNTAQLVTANRTKDARDAHHTWGRYLPSTYVMETRGAYGVSVYHDQTHKITVPGYAVPTIDTTGAGDAFVAGLADAECKYRCGISSIEKEDVQYANLVAAISTTRLGTEPVYKYEVHDYRSRLDSSAKIVQNDKRIIKSAKAAGKQIVVTNGVFDLFHEGHYNLLTKAKQSPNDYLVVLVNSDRSAARIKANRPFDSAAWRMRMAATVPAVDLVMEFDRETPNWEIRSLDADVLVKGDEYDGQLLPGHESVNEIRLVPMCTSILKRNFNTTAKAAHIAKRVNGVASGETKKATKDKASNATRPAPAATASSNSSRKEKGSSRRSSIPKRKARRK